MKKMWFLLILTGILLPGPNQKGYSQVNETPEVYRQQLDILLVLDNSGSMKTNDPQFLTREVVKNFLESLSENSRLGMVIFDQEADLAQPLTKVTDAQAREKFLNSLKKVNYNGQWTNSPAAIERAIYELKNNGREDSQKIIIFLTDGLVDTGDKEKDMEKLKWLKEELARESKQSAVRIFGIAFTEKADFSLIQTLALKTDGQYFRAFKAEEIQDIFKKIKQAAQKLKPEKVTTPPPIEEKPTPKSPGTTPGKKTGGISLLVIVALIVIISGIVILFFIFRRRSDSYIETGPDLPEKDVTATPEPPLPGAKLIDEESVISKDSILIEKKEIKIGREPGNDIIIPQESVSAFHATIKYENGYFYLEDQRSLNGTYLNNKKIQPNQPIRLKSGDRITFDINKFIFILPHQEPIGRTKLKQNGSPQTGGTVLRPEKAPGTPPQAPRDAPGPKEEDGKKRKKKQPKQEKETELKPLMCPNHPSRKATELCDICKKGFCKQCMTKKNGKYVCKECAEKL